MDKNELTNWALADGFRLDTITGLTMLMRGNKDRMVFAKKS